MSSQLVYPMVFYVFYIFVLGLFLFRARFNAVRSKKMDFRYFKSYTGTPPPEDVQIPARHFDHQFQAPLVFLIGGVAHLALADISYATVILAWLFVATRLIHSFIYLGRNHVLHRATAFALGWVVLVIFWGQLLITALEGAS